MLDLEGLNEQPAGSTDLTNKKSYQNPISEVPKKRYIADELDLPPIQRKPTEFSGLQNYGAVCYLNSLFQSYYFTPELRHMILSIDLDELSAYEKDSPKYRFLKEFQLFFLRLKYQSFKNHNTRALTSCFGWDTSDQADQMDFAEASGAIADKLETALFEAGLNEQFSKTFKGSTVNYTTCLNCQKSSENIQSFYHLILPIKNFQGEKFKTIDESLQFILNPEMMDGDNQYECSNCQSKQDALKGQRFDHMPDVLTISLMRFDFNMQTFQRMKINDYYKYDLQLDMSKYTGNKDDVYELCNVIVHRGDPYSGHYHAIVRDVLHESVDIEADMNKIKQNNGEIFEAHEKKRGWIDNTKEVPAECEDLIHKMMEENEQLDKYGKKVDHSEKKDKKKKSKKDKGAASTDPDLAQIESEPEDPFPTSVKRNEETEHLFNGWWDFDDTRVNKFNINKMSKYFGNNKENAYILVYRKVSLHSKNQEIKEQTPPASALDQIKKEEHSMETLCASYEVMKRRLRLNLRMVDDAYDHEKSCIRPGHQTPIEVDTFETLGELRSKARIAMGLKPDERFIMIAYEELKNGTLSFPQFITDTSGWKESFLLVKELTLYHDMNYLVVPVSHPRFTEFKNLLTIANVNLA